MREGEGGLDQPRKQPAIGGRGKKQKAELDRAFFTEGDEYTNRRDRAGRRREDWEDEGILRGRSLGGHCLSVREAGDLVRTSHHLVRKVGRRKG